MDSWLWCHKHSHPNCWIRWGLTWLFAVYIVTWCNNWMKTFFLYVHLRLFTNPFDFKKPCIRQNVAHLELSATSHSLFHKLISCLSVGGLHSFWNSLLTPKTENRQQRDNSLNWEQLGLRDVAESSIWAKF